jgi:hypothetical protein
MSLLQYVGEDNAQRRFQRFYWGIQNGMTRQEVEALARREFHGKLPACDWKTESAWYCLGPVDANYDAEFVNILLSKGRVVGVSYSPD